MTRRLISTGSPFETKIGYSRAATQGPWCWVAGTTGYDYAAMRMPESAAEQTRNCLATIEKALGEAGFALCDVVRARYYLASMEIYDEVVPVLGAAFGDIRPAATMVIAGLTAPEMKIEIEVDAYRPDAG